MPKYFTSIFTDKKGYGLSQYNEEVCIQEDEIINKVRAEEYERNAIFILSKARLEFFLKKYKGP